MFEKHIYTAGCPNLGSAWPANFQIGRVLRTIGFRLIRFRKPFVNCCDDENWDIFFWNFEIWTLPRKGFHDTANSICCFRKIRLGPIDGGRSKVRTLPNPNFENCQNRIQMYESTWFLTRNSNLRIRETQSKQGTLVFGISIIFKFSTPKNRPKLSSLPRVRDHPGLKFPHPHVELT